VRKLLLYLPGKEALVAVHTHDKKSRTCKEEEIKMEVILTVSSPPHIFGKDSIEKRMRDVIIALLPSCVFAVYWYGFHAFIVMAISVMSAVIAEFLFQRVVHKKVTIDDYSAAITGLLLAFNLPPGVPYWIPVIGSVFAIIAVKQLFGGLGANFINPALAARAFLLASFPVHMTNWTFAPSNVDAATGASLIADTTTSATYLARIKADPSFAPELSDYMALLFGKVGGCIGETSAVALFIGGIYLIARRVINWRIPVSYIGTFALLAFVYGREGFFTGHVLFEVLNGGLFMGAFFMATDYVTSPITPKGKVIFGIGCGFLLYMIRFYGGYPEGVCYSIIIMNLFVPLIDKYVRPRFYGKQKKVKVKVKS
jgi:electron transport complex protein RnfD